MELRINPNPPLVMHVDLNSCFATVCQQAFIHLRSKPLVIAAYATNSGCVVSPSIEAKRLGIKVGMTVRDAKLIFPQVLVRTPDPPLVRDVHMKLKHIFADYTPSVTPKSIDEPVLEFAKMEKILKTPLTQIGIQIKSRLRAEIGEWISCSIGIGTNRFLAKTAAGLKKPDGLDVIDSKNLSEILEKLELTDLPGINTRFQARLNLVGIRTPLDFLRAPLFVLQKQVFQSIVGYHWYLRLRGYELDDVEYGRKSFGHEYSLAKKTTNEASLHALLMKLSEKTGRRLRGQGFVGGGIHLAIVWIDGTFWHQAKKSHLPLFSTQEIFRHALLIFNSRPYTQKKVSRLSVSCYDLSKSDRSQLSLFDSSDAEKKVAIALDKINDKWGEFTVTSALMLGTDDEVIDRISFGGVKDLVDLYTKSHDISP